MIDLMQIKDFPGYSKDLNSKAILNTDLKAVEEFKKIRKLEGNINTINNDITSIKEEISTFKSDLSEIKDLILSLKK